MNDIPEGLIQTISMNILNKHIGSGETLPLVKLAEQTDYRAQFMDQYGFKPDQFKGDEEAERIVNTRRQQAESQIQDFYANQVKMLGQETPELMDRRKTMINELNQRSEAAKINHSIDRTRTIAKDNPNEFQEILDLSNKSQSALGSSFGKEIGTVLGTGLGGAAGAFIGSKMPKRKTGLLQKGIGGIAGMAAGNMIGKTIGENRDERMTGYNHEDVVKPFEAAYKLRQRQQQG